MTADALLTAFVPTYTLGSPFDSTVMRLTWIRLFAELSCAACALFCFTLTK